MYIYIYIYIYAYAHIYTYISTSIAYAHPVESVKQMCILCSQQLSNIHTCTCMVHNNTCKCMPTLCKKHAFGLVYARLFNCAAASLPWRLLQNYLESCANIVQAVVYCPPYRPPSCWQSFARRCSLKKSVQIHARSWRGRHCGVAQASSDHPRWCRLHPVCL